MIVKIFGILDLLAGLFMILLHFSIIPWNLAVGFMMYLFIKSYMFKGDFISMADFMSAVYFLFMIFGVKSFLAYVFAAFLFQKAFFSLK